MDTHANVLRWRKCVSARPSRAELLGYRRTPKGPEFGDPFPAKQLPGRWLIRASEIYQTSPLEVCPCVGLFAVDFEHPLTPRLASLLQGKRESVVGAAKSRWQLARVPCTC